MKQKAQTIINDINSVTAREVKFIRKEFPQLAHLPDFQLKAFILCYKLGLN